MIREQIEEEVERIERKVGELLVSRGVDLSTVGSVISDALAEWDERWRKSASPQEEFPSLPAEYGALLPIHLSLASIKRDLMENRDDGDLIGLLCVAAEALGRWRQMEEMGEFFPDKVIPLITKSMAQRAANARHAENREDADRVKSWYRENRHLYSSLAHAAEAVMKVEPVKYRTAYKHISQEDKTLRSARKE